MNIFYMRKGHNWGWGERVDYYGLNCILPNDVEILAPVMQNVTLLGNWVFSYQVKMRSLGWAFIHCDYCLYPKGEI